MVKGQVFRNALLGPDVNRVGHPVDNRMAILAQADDVLDEVSATFDRLALVTMKAFGRFVHEGMGVPGPHGRYGDKEEEHQEGADDPFSSC
jgi:hypothetical protein